MSRFLILEENGYAGFPYVGTWEADTAEEAVQKMRNSDREFSDMSSQYAKEDGDSFLAYEIADCTIVDTR